jgi:uncharacterized integral membrane protein
MRRLLAWIVLFPLTIVLVLFAVANRTTVTISFDPFSPATPAYAVTTPLFLVMFAAMILGAIVGAAAMLWNQIRWWRAARRAERETARLKAEAETMRIVREEAAEARGLTVKRPPGMF